MQSITNYDLLYCKYFAGVLGNVLKQVAPPIPYSTIPNFPQAKLEGHDGKLLVGLLEDIPIVVFQGRAHAYQGFTLSEVCLVLD